MEGVIRRLRLTSGLVMLAYVTTHFVNHSLGLVSVQLMDRALQVIYHYWASPLGGVILYGAFAIHYSLALWALWLRRSLKMPFAEAAQLVLGFSIPFLLVDHVLQTRVADTFYGSHYGYYVSVLYLYFVADPLRGGLQFTVLLIAWVHAMIGLRFWLRLKPWYERWQPILYAFALLMPTFAILGALEGGSDIMTMAEDPAWVDQLAKDHPRPAPADAGVPRSDGGVGALRFPGRAPRRAGRAAARWRWERRRGVLRMTYPSGRVVADRARRVGTGSEPDGRHSACLRVRRPRALLHLPHQDRRPEGGDSAGRARGGEGAAPRGRGARRSARLPAPPARRSARDPAAAGDRPGAGRVSPPGLSAGRRAGDRDPVRRSARPSPSSPNRSFPTTWCSS